MAQPYVGEIRMFAGNFAPAGWEFCQGQLLSISENDVLFSLIGTTYGGDGESTFAVPDLRGRLPLHQGAGFVLGEAGGVEEVTLTVSQIPTHTHPLLATTGSGGPNPQGSVLASSASVSAYRQSSASTPMAPTSIGPVGGSQPHSNLQPYLCVDFIISRFGLYPSPI
ncbi:phage tail protein [Nocardioides lijunqiniae]|uniref:phage tail protein n=1 Tax=Nocardioides lijunqiniae TaxID=2760832 RepID=UPI001878C957|nr:tail fiber protein [Nocardioides lijunqiniae]